MKPIITTRKELKITFLIAVVFIIIGIYLFAYSTPQNLIDSYLDEPDTLGGISGDFIKAQTFKTSKPYLLSKISIPLSRSGIPGNITLELRNGGVIGEPLFTETSKPQVPHSVEDYVWVDFNVQPPIHISGTYAIVLSAEGDENHLYYWHYVKDNPTYENGLFAHSEDNGNTWSEFNEAPRDALFKTYEARTQPTVLFGLTFFIVGIFFILVVNRLRKKIR